MKYKIEITETLQRIVEIEADSINDALDIAYDKYHNEEIVLDSSDFIDKEIKIIN